MTLTPLAQFIQRRVEILMYTGHSIIYVDRAEPNVVVKAEHIWIDGEPYDRAPSADNTSYHLSREASVYLALGSHVRITPYVGLDYNTQGEAIALKTERAANGNLRLFIQETRPAPPMRQRLEMAVQFAQGVTYLHSKGVIWGDLSTRNALVFDGQNIRLCDFASSALEGVYPELGDYTYEPRYRPALAERQVDELSMMQQELYALGSAVYEITEWKRPYAEFNNTHEVDFWTAVLGRGTVPEISENNAARHIILHCWGFQYESAQEVADDLGSLAAPALLGFDLETKS